MWYQIQLLNRQVASTDHPISASDSSGVFASAHALLVASKGLYSITEIHLYIFTIDVFVIHCNCIGILSYFRLFVTNYVINFRTTRNITTLRFAGKLIIPTLDQKNLITNISIACTWRMNFHHQRLLRVRSQASLWWYIYVFRICPKLSDVHTHLSVYKKSATMRYG